jgi:hypothetical protein
MAGDLPIVERLIIVGEPGSAGAPVASAEPTEQGRALHLYGDRVKIVEMGVSPEGEPQSPEPVVAPDTALLQQLTETEALGAAAFQLRMSPGYLTAKQNRPRQGQVWNLPPGGCTSVATPPASLRAAAAAAPPTSAYLEGSVAVGIIIVGGPTATLQFSAGERAKVVAEVQNGLSFHAATNPAAGLTFVYDIHPVEINVEADPGAADLEGLWRDPAMAALGYSASWDGVYQYIEHIRQQFQTRWTYCAFFTKYPVPHFAYAYFGGPHSVMHYDNDGWGPDNIDRVFAHETGHIFNCPDEYEASGCDCGGNWGRWSKPNTNCANCAPAGGISCIMKYNDWTMCPVTPAHLGWMPARLFAKNSGKAMDVAGASADNGAPIIQWPYYGGENQLVRPDLLPDGFYRLVCQHSGKVIDVAGASTDSGAQIIQWDWHGGDNQRFRLESLGDGYVRVIAKHSGKVIDVAGASTGDGAQLIQWDWHGGDNQRWLTTQPIVSKHSGKILDVAGASTDNGAQIIQWDHHGGPNQIFRPEPVGDGSFRFVAQHSGKVLDVAGVSTDNGAPIIQWDWHGWDNQRFWIQPLGDGHVRVIAKHSGKVIDVAGASTDSGAQIIQWDWHGGNNQRWLLPLW